MPNTATADTGPPAPAPIEEAASICVICGEHADVRKPLAWWDRGRKVAHLKCYDEAWYTVGVAEGVGLPEAAS